MTDDKWVEAHKRLLETPEMQLYSALSSVRADILKAYKKRGEQPMDFLMGALDIAMDRAREPVMKDFEALANRAGE